MSVTDNFMIVITAFLVALALFVGFFYLSTLTTEFQNVEIINDSAHARVVFDEGLPKATSKFDMFFITVFIMLAITYWITSWMLGTNPIFLILNLIFLVIGILSSFFISNVWTSATDITLFASTKAALPIMNHVLSNFPLYIIIISLVGLVFMFGKPYIAGGSY